MRIHLGAAVARECFVDLVDVGGNGLEAGVEAIEPLLLDLLERLLGFLCPLPSGFEFWNGENDIIRDISLYIFRGNHMKNHRKN